MIIECINCNKKFEVDSTLIPGTGRTIQCGSCSHIWFFTPKLQNTSEILIENNESNKIVEPKVSKRIIKKDKSLSDKKTNEIEKFKAPVKYNKKINILSLNNILSYFIVSIVTFISLIIVIDTFKSPLNNIYPNTELLLYNLFESVKDIILFIKDLFVRK